MRPKRTLGGATRGVHPSTVRKPFYDISAMPECRSLSDPSAARSLLPSLPAHILVSEQATTALHILPAATVKRIIKRLDNCRRNLAGMTATPGLNPLGHFHPYVTGHNVLFACTPDAITVRFVASDRFFNVGHSADFIRQ